MKTDAALASLCRDIYLNTPTLLSWESLIDFIPLMTGAHGTENMKCEAAGLLYSMYFIVVPSGKLKKNGANPASLGFPDRASAIARVRTILNHWIIRGIFSLPGPNGPISEALSPTHSQHNLRFLAYVTLVSHQSKDIQTYNLCCTLWSSIAILLNLASIDSIVYPVGTRAFPVGNPSKKSETGRAGTNKVIDEVNAILNKGKTHPNVWKGDDMLAPQILNFLLGRGANLFDTSSPAKIARTVDPIQIYRSIPDNTILCYMDPAISHPNPEPPGAQIAAGVYNGKQFFEVDPSIANPDIGYYAYGQSPAQEIISSGKVPLIADTGKGETYE